MTGDRYGNAKLAKIHCNKRDLGLADDRDRAIIARDAGGKRSGADLDTRERGRPLDEFKQGRGRGGMRKATGTFANLVEALGRDLAERIVAEFGGTFIYVPLRPTPPLIERLGVDGANRLARAFATERIYVPTRAAEMVRARVIEMHRQGAAYNQIARTVGCTVMRVAQILSSPHRQ